MTAQKDAFQPTGESEAKERGDDARRKDAREEAQVNAQQGGAKNSLASDERDFEGGFGGQEDLEDRYATTSGEH